jgi:ASC-1-like (ASCH) protein
MDHVAIMQKEPLELLLAGKKTVESRWSVHRSAPWGKVHVGDRIYFKRSSGLVEARAVVSRMLEYPDVTKSDALRIAEEFGNSIGIDKQSLSRWWHPRKKYCSLYFLDDIQRVVPFAIDKNGYAASSGWLVVPQGIDAIRAA